MARSLTDEQILNIVQNARNSANKAQNAVSNMLNGKYDDAAEAQRLTGETVALNEAGLIDLAEVVSENSLAMIDLADAVAALLTRDEP